MTARSPHPRTPSVPPSPTAPPARPRSTPAADGKCHARTKTGKVCRTAARPGSAYCFAHDPDLAARRREGNRKGAAHANAPRRRRTLPSAAIGPKLDSSRALVSHLGDLIRRVETGELDTRPAAVVAQLANVLLRALAQVETVARIEAIERAVATLAPEAAAGVRDDLAAVKAASEARQ